MLWKGFNKLRSRLNRIIQNSQLLKKQYYFAQLCRGKSIKEMKQYLYLNEQKENIQPDYQLQNNANNNLKSLKEMKQQLRLNEQKEYFLPDCSIQNRNLRGCKTFREINEKNEHFRFDACDGEIELPKKIQSQLQKNIIPTNVVEYVEEIFTYLRSTELKYVCNSNYMTFQNDINPTMRAILFDWLVDVQLKFKLLPETLYLTFNIIDRYLEKVQMSRKKLQLVGIAALFIACKYEEIYPPQIGYYIQITENAYNKKDLLDMEAQIIEKLEFNFTITSAYRFFERYEQIANLLPKESALCKYLIELCQIEYRMLRYQPSMLAAASIYLANKLYKKQIAWENYLSIETKYNENEIKQCAKEMCILLEQSGKNNLTAIKRKYASSNFLAISQIQIERIQK